ncbi:MAG: hypothetical protein RR053_03160 [Evtepia sp.]
MDQHFFVLMHATNYTETKISRLYACKTVEEIEKIIQDWLVQKCAMDCCRPEDAKTPLPELTFVCPHLKEPKDVEQYNGFYFYEGYGGISLFLDAVYDEKTAKRFRADVMKEFQLDQILSDEADQLMDDLDVVVESFRSPMDWRKAYESIDTLIRQGGIALF